MHNETSPRPSHAPHCMSRIHTYEFHARTHAIMRFMHTSMHFIYSTRTVQSCIPCTHPCLSCIHRYSTALATPVQLCGRLSSRLVIVPLAFPVRPLAVAVSGADQRHAATANVPDKPCYTCASRETFL
jgi:hypothetical protein